MPSIAVLPTDMQARRLIVTVAGLRGKASALKHLVPQWRKKHGVAALNAPYLDRVVDVDGRWLETSGWMLQPGCRQMNNRRKMERPSLATGILVTELCDTGHGADTGAAISQYSEF
jgi:hypothetical protein